ncbi:hypothetical protein VNO80_08715 [Phaseolus coccineus]|uniref:Late embryogenesis abundant protein LEA-2 subgroup domain-containing protein n=1 Tax=Phaseolus coccineus TaxID=3886 RepID=A0AAN9NA51_PHACN
MSEIMGNSLSNPAGRYANNYISTEELIAGFPSRKKEEKSSKCLVYTLAIFVLMLLIWLILAFVTSRLADPKIELKSARLKHNTNSYSNISTTSSFNVTMLLRITFTNPNFVSFHYGKSTVSMVYENSSESVGSSKLKAGILEAKETKDIKLTVHARFGQKNVLVKPNLSDMLKLRSYAKLSGSLHMLKVFRKTTTIQMSCTINLNFTSFFNQYFQC